MQKIANTDALVGCKKMVSENIKWKKKYVHFKYDYLPSFFGFLSLLFKKTKQKKNM